MKVNNTIGAARTALWGAAVVGVALQAAPALAGDDYPMEQSTSVVEEPTWVEWTVGYAGAWTSFNLNGLYYSAPEYYDGLGGGNGEGPRFGPWIEDYDDTDGWLNGVTGELVFPQLRGSSIDIRYLTGDLEGDFRINPMGMDMGFEGEADVDRDLLEVGASVPLFAWLSGRVEYYNIDDDTVWKYGDGSREEQEYDHEGLRFGLLGEQEVPLGGQFVATLHAFLGGVYFDIEHEEKSIGATKGHDGWGYFLRGGVQVAHPLTDSISVVGGASYEFMDLDGDDFEMEQHGLNVMLGLSGSF